MAWYKEWFGQEYLDVYAHRDFEEADRHVDFVERIFEGGEAGAVLDLACGVGRHTAALRRRGYRALGVDLSVTLLAHPPKKPCVAGDMRRLPFGDRAFDWVLNFFTSFGYFEHERENFRVLEEVVRVLAPGGRFLIDFLNRERVLDGLRPREVRQVDGRQVTIERWYDAAAGRINKRIRIEGGARGPRTYLESVRAYDPEEVANGLRWVGLELDTLYGNFEGETFDRESERVIFVGHRPA